MNTKLPAFLNNLREYKKQKLAGILYLTFGN